MGARFVGPKKPEQGRISHSSGVLMSLFATVRSVTEHLCKSIRGGHHLKEKRAGSRSCQSLPAVAGCCHWQSVYQVHNGESATTLRIVIIYYH